MKQSQLFYKTLKEVPKDEVSVNAQLLLRAGFIDKLASGIYSYLPLGEIVLRKINTIIREEINKIGGQELFLPALHPKAIWEKTKRWDSASDIMYQFKDKSGKEWGLGFTHEEVITDIVKRRVSSYKDLPLYLFQIQTKFRDELRARSGLIRCKEFLMKDLYSFHASQTDFEKYYQRVKGAYFKIFKRCALEAIFTEASGGVFSKVSHEFQVLTPSGEDIIYYCPKKDYAFNKEIAAGKGNRCKNHKNEVLKEGRAIEIGNIFPLGTRFSKAFEAFFRDKDGQQKPIIMGSYGIGPGRVMATVVEVHHDKSGIIWPKEIAPFLVHLIPVGESKKVRKMVEKLHKDLQEEKIEVLYDDRLDKTAGEKFVEADLIGIPFRIVVSERTLSKNSLEVKERNKKKTKLVSLSSLSRLFKIKSKIKNSKTFNLS